MIDPWATFCLLLLPKTQPGGKKELGEHNWWRNTALNQGQDMGDRQALRMLWHTQLECSRFISCHTMAMHTIPLINAKRAKAFIECPGLAGHMEVFMASWLVLRQKRRLMADNYCSIIK